MVLKMNPIIYKVAAALKQANEELYAIIKFNVDHKTWEIWIDNKPYLVNYASFDEAEDKCEELNYEYAAKKAVEAICVSIELKLPAILQIGQSFTIKNNTNGPVWVKP